MRFRDEDYLKVFPREKPKRVKVEIIEKKQREQEIMTNKEPVEELEEVEVVEEEEVKDGNERDDKSSE